MASASSSRHCRIIDTPAPGLRESQDAAASAAAAAAAAAAAVTSMDRAEAPTDALEKAIEGLRGVADNLSTSLKKIRGQLDTTLTDEQKRKSKSREAKDVDLQKLENNHKNKSAGSCAKMPKERKDTTKIRSPAQTKCHREMREDSSSSSSESSSSSSDSSSSSSESEASHLKNMTQNSAKASRRRSLSCEPPSIPAPQTDHIARDKRWPKGRRTEAVNGSNNTYHQTTQLLQAASTQESDRSASGANRIAAGEKMKGQEAASVVPGRKAEDYSRTTFEPEQEPVVIRPPQFSWQGLTRLRLLCFLAHKDWMLQFQEEGVFVVRVCRARESSKVCEFFRGNKLEEVLASVNISIESYIALETGTHHTWSWVVKVSPNSLSRVPLPINLQSVVVQQKDDYLLRFETVSDQDLLKETRWRLSTMLSDELSNEILLLKVARVEIDGVRLFKSVSTVEQHAKTKVLHVNGVVDYDAVGKNLIRGWVEREVILGTCDGALLRIAPVETCGFCGSDSLHGDETELGPHSLSSCPLRKHQLQLTARQAPVVATTVKTIQGRLSHEKYRASRAPLISRFAQDSLSKAKRSKKTKGKSKSSSMARKKQPETVQQKLSKNQKKRIARGKV